MNRTILFLSLFCVFIASPNSFVLGQCLATQATKYQPMPSAGLNEFGSTIDTDGELVIVGVRLDSANGLETGTAYLFGIDGSQIFELLPNQSVEFDFYGSSVAVANGVGLVGARGDSNDTGSFSGSVYLFDVSTGQQTGKIVPDDVGLLDQFGSSLSVSGNLAIVGTPGDDDNGNSSGSAYIYDIFTETQITKLLADDGSSSDCLGTSVDIDGTHAIVGSPDDDDNGSESGSAYVFDAITGQQIVKLLPEDGNAGDSFGQSVAISGGFALVGAPEDDDNGSRSGSAYLFNATTGEQILKLAPKETNSFDRFGNSVAIDGVTAVIGAFRYNGSSDEVGTAFVFDLQTCVESDRFSPDDIQLFDRFGTAVSISDQNIVVSSEGDGVGSAYLFQHTCNGILLGNVNQDGSVDLLDVSPFVSLITMNEFQIEADINEDGQVDLLDVSPFVGLLTGS